ncbi:MAG: thermonuclease family protein [Anaeroplasmataceae bacterium]|nr:thermonuclease family protein [Anaeroplasmataceae bacterium]
MKRVIKFISIFIFFLFCGISLTSCSSVGDVTAKLKLTKDYEGKTFFKDGIEKATLARKTDGDTSGFWLESGGYVTIRYYAIDTPESTKDYDKWGKAASIFVGDLLENATELILEGSQTPPKVDSYGSRYLGYVWFRNSETEDFRNLNLFVIENGFSENKLFDTNHEYYQYFKDAEAAAKKNKLHIWSNDEDQYYSEEVIDVNLKELNENPKTYYDSCKFVRVDAYIKSYTGDYMTIAQMIDNKEYTFQIFNNLASASIMTFGNRIKFVGRVLMYDDNYQITALNYVQIGSTDKHCQLVTAGYYLKFNDSFVKGYNFGSILVESATRNSKGELIIVGTCKSEKADEVKVTLNCGSIIEAFDTSVYRGKTLIVSAAFCEEGCKKTATEITATVLDLANIIIK